MDDDQDDIAAWAANLIPEGAPGAIAQNMRALLGDAGYEKAVALNDAAAAGYLQRQTLINQALTLAVLYGILFGFVGLVGAVVLVLHMIFS